MFTQIFFCWNKKKVRLIDGSSKAQFENDVAKNSQSWSFLAGCDSSCKCAFVHAWRWKTKFVCFSFKDLLAVSSRLLLAHVVAQRRKDSSHFNCTRELPHQRCIFRCDYTILSEWNWNIFVSGAWDVEISKCFFSLHFFSHSFCFCK